MAINVTFLEPDETSGGPLLRDVIRVRLSSGYHGTPSAVFMILDPNGAVLYSRDATRDTANVDEFYYTGVDGLGLTSTLPYVVVAVAKVVDGGTVIDGGAAALYVTKY